MSNKAVRIVGHEVFIEISEASQHGGQARAFVSHVMEHYFDGYRNFYLNLPGNIAKFASKSVAVLKELPDIDVTLTGEGASLIKKPKPVLVQARQYLKKNQNGPGYVYMAAHPWMSPDFRVKIGCTVGKVEDRLKSISRNGCLPDDYEELVSFKVTRCLDAEKVAHAALRYHRDRGSEWFELYDGEKQWEFGSFADTIKKALKKKNLLA
jgi:hypothetical protein